ncbi:hypothetical protein WDU94_012628 [Cyamophila willieti]
MCNRAAHNSHFSSLRFDQNGFQNDSSYTAQSRLRLDARLECYAKQYAQVFIKHVDFKRTRVRVEVSHFEIIINFKKCNKKKTHTHNTHTHTN